MPTTSPPPSTVDPVPKPSTFLAELLATLSTLPRPSASGTRTVVPKKTNLSKPYLLTLHALFPSTLLPALDLLDRHLVSRHVLAEETDEARYRPSALVPTNVTNAQQGPSNEMNTKNRTEDTDPDVSLKLKSGFDTKNTDLRLPVALNNHLSTPNSLTQRQVYYVKSSQWQQFTKFRRFGGSSMSRTGLYDFDKSYEVRPWAWSCTCAAFAFGAYNIDSGDDFHDGEYENDYEDNDEFGERGSVRKDPGDGDLGQEEELDWMSGEERRERWEWGGLMGMYRDSERSGDVPPCKHLLACVLAEWWDEARDLVEVKVVGRAEVAGWAAGWGG